MLGTCNEYVMQLDEARYCSETTLRILDSASFSTDLVHSKSRMHSMVYKYLAIQYHAMRVFPRVLVECESNILENWHMCKALFRSGI